MSRAGSAILVLGAVLAAAAVADAMCNAVPTAARGFASSRGEVDRPYASPGRHVRLRLGDCDPADVFVPDATTVDVEFMPPSGAPATVAVPASDIVSITPSELVFVFPDTRALLGTLRTGPASIVARVGDRQIVSIDRIGSRDGGCAFRQSPVFPGFTALPPPNRFHCIAKGVCPGPDDDPAHVRATVDDVGNLLVPWDWSDVFPPGAGFDPIARFVRAGQSSLEAFAPPDPRAGHGIVLPSVAYVSSHTLTGNVLPPLLDVGPPSGSGPFPGSTIAGTVDSLEGVVRFSRRLGDDPTTEIFDLHDRLAGGIGAIVIDQPQASEEPLVDLRSLRASEHVTAIEEPTRGPRTIGMLVYDNRSGALGRLPPVVTGAELPRRITVSDGLAAYYEHAQDADTPGLTVFEIARLMPGAGVQPIPTTALIATNLFGSNGDGAAPAVGRGMVGGYGGDDRVPTVFDVSNGATLEGIVLGGDLVETGDGILNRRLPERFAPFGGELAPLGPGQAGHAFAAADRAVFLVCDGPCSAGGDQVLMLLDDDGSLRELDRNVGAPFVFTGSLIGLAAYEDASFGAASTARIDLDGDGAFTGVHLRLYDLSRERPMAPRLPNGRPVSLEGGVPARPVSSHVLTLAVDEASAGPLNCDADVDDHVVVLVNGVTGQVFDTREPAAAPIALGQGRGITTFTQTENALGEALGSDFLNVWRDGDGDEIPDPFDNCPLHPNVTQRDRDGDGDACDADCAGGACSTGAPRSTTALRSCQRRVVSATEILLADGGDAGVAKARATLSRCDDGAFAALGYCGDTIDALVGDVSAPGCLFRAVLDAVATIDQGIGTPAAGGNAARCAADVAAAITRDARRRFHLLARCRAAMPVGTDDDDVASGDAVVKCRAVPANARQLAGYGRRVHRRIASACGVEDLRTIAVCGGAPSTVDAVADARGTGGCLLTRQRLAIDALVRALTTTADPPGPAAAPCPARPQPSPTPTPRPGSLRLRIEGHSPASPPPFLDMGWLGFARNEPAFAGTELTADFTCAASAPCALHLPLAGVPFGAPVPIAAQFVSVCLTFTGNDDANGTFDPESGALDLALPLAMRAFSGPSLDQPCPSCLTADGRPDVGEYGNCSGGPNGGGPCRVEGVNTELGAVGGTSNDCPPNAAAMIDDHAVLLRATTGTVAFAPGSDSPRCTSTGNSGVTCWCDTCNNANADACASNADCPPSGGAPGVCGGRRCLGGAAAGNPCSGTSSCPGGLCNRPGEPTRRNGCFDGVCTPIASGDGVCASDPPSRYCEVAPWRGCGANSECPFGLCVDGALRPCFPDVIERAGASDPPVDGHAEPTLVGAFCVAPSAMATVNYTLGLPGPATFTLPARVDFVP